MRKNEHVFRRGEGCRAGGYPVKNLGDFFSSAPLPSNPTNTHPEREVVQSTTMPPKRGKKGKRRGDSSSDDDASTSAAAAVMASLKQPAPVAAAVDGSETADNAAGKATTGKQARGKAKGKKKGKGGRNNNDSDSDDGDALDPLAHLRGGRGKGGKRAGLDSDEEERPKKPLTKKEKRRLEEEQRRREKEVRQFGIREAWNGSCPV